MRNVNGILLLDKPGDISSNGALQRVKRLYNAKKAGHTGNLDPLATGMLPICLGEATKFSQFLLDASKTYQVTARLGEQTSTGDLEGEVIATKPVTGLTRQRVQSALEKFLGGIEQIPPMYSAIKFQGKPLYELARKGIEIDRKPRPVTIFSLELEAFTDDELSFVVHCSKGTYVRTLVEDIGRELGSVAHVTALRRTQVMPYGNAMMYSFDTLNAIAERLGNEGLDACLLPVDTAVQNIPAVTLSQSAVFYLRMGQPVRSPFVLTTHLVRLHAEDTKFLGIGEVMEDGRVKPHRLIAT